jgi:hypothetical protein
MSDDILEYSGDLEIEILKLVTITKQIVDLDDYLIELNIFEDIFNNFVHGQIQLSDSRNMISDLNIIGEEYLIVKIRTPSLDKYLEKTFRVYSITDRQTVKDNNTQIYTLHFCSFEAIVDMNTPLYKPFQGRISDIVENIYLDFLEVPRSYVIEDPDQLVPTSYSTPLYLLNDTDNSVKFISPGWSPSKCINWLASRSIPKETKACDFLFWETIHGFYFGNIEKIYQDTKKNQLTRGTYFYYPANTVQPANIVEKMFIAEDFEVYKTTDYIKNYTEGYLASRVVTVDLLTKRYQVTDYDYLSEFEKFNHLDENAMPLFAADTLRNPATHVRFFPINTHLFTDFKNNYTDKIPLIYGNRRSKLSELNNYVVNITVPGRFDMETGSIIDFWYPDTEEQDDKSASGKDNKYAGSYLITAIRHKINLKRHMMIMEIVKDSLSNNKE